MKSDLNKQFCERERYLSGNSFTNYRHLKEFNPHLGDEGENFPQRESMKLRYNAGWGDGRKGMAPNFRLLQGEIRKAVGKPWNNFYSEFCERFDKRTLIGETSISHLKRIIEQDLYEEDGELFIKNHYRKEALKGSSTEFYVDPKDGIIKRNKQRVTYKEAARIREVDRLKRELSIKRVIDKSNILHFIDGIWYHFTLKEAPKGTLEYVKPQGKEVFKIGYLPNSCREKTWEQMSTWEQKRHGVPRFVGETAKDLFTNEIVFTDINEGRGGLGQRGRLPQIREYTSKVYHATKQTASHKMLKKAGIV